MLPVSIFTDLSPLKYSIYINKRKRLTPFEVENSNASPMKNKYIHNYVPNQVLTLKSYFS